MHNANNWSETIKELKRLLQGQRRSNDCCPGLIASVVGVHRGNVCRWLIHGATPSMPKQTLVRKWLDLQLQAIDQGFDNHGAKEWAYTVLLLNHLFDQYRCRKTRCQAALGRYLGCDPNQIKDWRNGSWKPVPKTRVRVREWIDQQLDQLGIDQQTLLREGVYKLCDRARELELQIHRFRKMPTVEEISFRLTSPDLSWLQN